MFGPPFTLKYVRLTRSLPVSSAALPSRIILPVSKT